MKHFTEKELSRLEGCHPSLIILAYNVKKRYNCWLVSGFRTAEEQYKLYVKGASQLDGTEGKESYHQKGLAIDFYPKGHEKTGFESITDNEWEKQSRVVKREAEDLGLTVTWGGDWKNFLDLPHFQIEA